jgi:uncharacterized protein YqgC (DUF456 family)
VTFGSTMFAAMWVLSLLIALIVGWIMTIVCMPGNWVVVAAAALYSGLGPADGRLAIGWPLVGVLAGMALLGEIVELAAAAAGVKRVGGSRRSAVLALLGAVAGGLAGMFVGLPIPVVGSLVAAVLFAGLGAMGGAMLGEGWKGRSFDASWRVGTGAFLGRVFGTLAKVILGSAMVALVLAALVLE